MVTADGQSREVILTEVSCHPIYRWPKKTSGRKSISSFRTRTCPRKPCFSEVSPCHQSRSWRWNPNVFPIPTRGLYQSGMVTPVPQDVMWSPQLDCALRSQSCGQCKILAKFSGMDALRGNCGILRAPFAAASPTSFRIVAQEWVEVKYLDLGSLDSDTTVQTFMFKSLKPSFWVCHGSFDISGQLCPPKEWERCWGRRWAFFPAGFWLLWQERWGHCKLSMNNADGCWWSVSCFKGPGEAEGRCSATACGRVFCLLAWLGVANECSWQALIEWFVD